MSKLFENLKKLKHGVLDGSLKSPDGSADDADEKQECLTGIRRMYRIGMQV